MKNTIHTSNTSPDATLNRVCILGHCRAVIGAPLAGESGDEGETIRQ
ncbi:MAG: hypothetical protein ACRC2B_08150 [Rubrivivax sp.]